MTVVVPLADSPFQSTPSLRKVTFGCPPLNKFYIISIHTFLAEGDFDPSSPSKPYAHFNPHLPCGRWLLTGAFGGIMLKFQSTPSLRKVTQDYKDITGYTDISIHTFLAEGDCCGLQVMQAEEISIHTFLAEGDQYNLFLSSYLKYFNPHLPCGRWLCCDCCLCRVWFISIHTFLAEGDQPFHIFLNLSFKFQSTPSLRKVTSYTWYYRYTWYYFNPHLPCGRWPYHWKGTKMTFNISIHTFLAEGDWMMLLLSHHPCLFQSTPSLRKVTVQPPKYLKAAQKFQSTPSLRKVTGRSDRHDQRP